MIVLLFIFADVSPAALAPAQHDINIAVLAVLLGSLLVGYERLVRARKIIRHREEGE